MNLPSADRPARTVLFLEDDPDFGAVTADAMRGAGLNVLMAPHPWDALQHLDARTPIDLFLTDLRMPPGTPHGFAMARMARHRNPNLKVLFVTAYRELAQAEDDPPGEIVFKPVDPNLLAAMVSEALAAA